jgi:hypothetical protein
VVPAGGDGTRLQELTHRIPGDSRPKQFCHFFGGKATSRPWKSPGAPRYGDCVIGLSCEKGFVM